MVSRQTPSVHTPEVLSAVSWWTPRLAREKYGQLQARSLQQIHSTTSSLFFSSSNYPQPPATNNEQRKDCRMHFGYVRASLIGSYIRVISWASVLMPAQQFLWTHSSNFNTAIQPILTSAIFLPPLAVFMKVGLDTQFWINIVCCIFIWFPAIIHALYVVLRD